MTRSRTVGRSPFRHKVDKVDIPSRTKRVSNSETGGGREIPGRGIPPSHPAQYGVYTAFSSCLTSPLLGAPPVSPSMLEGSAAPSGVAVTERTALFGRNPWVGSPCVPPGVESLTVGRRVPA